MDKRAVLERYFGYTQFRAGQAELIDGVLGGRDVFGIMPTGGGKSLCYQVPALILPGITLVISPLISLMMDQVQSLKTAGVPAAFINSTLSPGQLQRVYRNLADGAYKIVYVAPERLDSAEFLAVASALNIPFIAVDEAHCISQWGQDFRPSYLRIVDFIDALPARPVVGAFTATATKQVREDVERILKLDSPVRTVTGFDRPNLYFDVIKPERKDRELLRLLTERKDKSGIIYCATRKNVERVCEALQAQGFAATRYHAGLEEAERGANQEDFLYDRKTVMVATNAFGMGIDKSNVGYVIHYNMPKSIEAYYQEAGRAGRDGSAADCILLYNASDIMTARFLIDHAAENEELSDEQREMVLAQDLARLNAMVGYCKTGRCLREYILQYFGQASSARCGNCGNCGGEFETVDITREAQMILSCVKRIRDKLGYSVGMTLVGRVLRGSREQRVTELGLETLSTWGIMRTTPRSEIRRLAEHLEEAGYLCTEPEHKTVCLTERASAVLFRGEQVELHLRKGAAPIQTPAKPSVGDNALYEVLRALRADLARDAGVPAYVIFSNATLTDMAQKAPTTMEEFLQVSGVGEVKAEKYGWIFLGQIQQYLESK